jgi:hypothetical protein
MGTLEVPVNAGFRGRALITARRTDGFGFYHTEYYSTVINNGGSISEDVSTLHESSTDAALDTRINIAGSSVEFQVKGKAGQDWHWMAVLFNREIA